MTRSVYVTVEPGVTQRQLYEFLQTWRDHDGEHHGEHSELKPHRQRR